MEPMIIFITLTIGLVIGSFLNVVIYRLPKMILQTSSDGFNLAIPRSHCPFCQNTLRAHHNIPLLSFIFLNRKCAHCANPISWQYPLVESIVAIISLIIVRHFGINWETFAALIFTWSLIALTIIDLKTLLLPDVITLPLLWVGLIVNCFHLFTTPEQAIFGASAGYLVLWITAKIFYLLRKQEGMGYGDFKLMAALGAWMGINAVLPVLLIATVSGSLCGLFLLSRKKIKSQQPIPFGPFLALAGWIVLLYYQQFLFWIKLFWNEG